MWGESDPDAEQADADFMSEVEQAGAGGWEALGLDEPGADRQPGFQPVSIDEFMNQ